MSIRTIIGVLAMAVSFAAAQDVTPSIGANSKAMLFTFSGLNALNANSYNGGIGAKFYVTNPIAVRGGLAFAQSSQTIAANPAAGQTGIDGSNSSLTYGVNAAIEYHLMTSRVSPYVGGAVGISSTSTEAKSVVNVTGGVQTTTKNGGGSGMTFGGGGLAGIEFFLTKEISLAAEYLLGWTLNSPSDQEITAGTTTTTTKFGSTSTIRVATTGALTLAVHF